MWARIELATVIKKVRIHNWLLDWLVLSIWASVLLFNPTWSKRELSELGRVKVGKGVSSIGLIHSRFICLLPASVCLFLMLLVVLEHLSVHMQFPKEACDSYILLGRLKTCQVHHWPLLLIKWEAAATFCLFLSAFLIHTDGWEGLPEEEEGLIQSLSLNLPLVLPGCWLVESKIVVMVKTDLDPMLKENWCETGNFHLTGSCCSGKGAPLETLFFPCFSLFWLALP